MKRLLFLLLVYQCALKSFAQCPTWVGSSIDNAKALKSLIQRHFQLTLNNGDTIDGKHYKSLVYKDKKGWATFTIGWYVKESDQSTSIQPTINDITIKG